MTTSLVHGGPEHATGADLDLSEDLSDDLFDAGADVTVEVAVEARLHRALRGYLDAVAHRLGVGLESCTLDVDLPTSAYLALDRPLPAFPDRELALLWDEVHGWAAAIETHSGEDLIVVSYLDAPTVTPPPRLLARFVHDLRTGGRRLTRPDPPALRTAGDHQALARDLESAARPN